MKKTIFSLCFLLGLSGMVGAQSEDLPTPDSLATQPENLFEALQDMMERFEATPFLNDSLMLGELRFEEEDQSQQFDDWWQAFNEMMQSFEMQLEDAFPPEEWRERFRQPAEEEEKNKKKRKTYSLWFAKKYLTLSIT